MPPNDPLIPPKILETLTTLTNQELLHPSWEMTKQLLEAVEIELVDQLPKIEGIVMKPEFDRATVYVAVKDEPFYIGVHFAVKDQIELNSVDTEPRIHLSYIVTSEELDSVFLSSITRLTPTEVIHKGVKYNRTWQYNYNGLSFESSDKPGSFDGKMDELLSYFETDAAGIKALQQHTGATDIFVTICYHTGNGNFTHLGVSHNLISRLHALGLMLTFDLYVSGKPVS